MRKKSSKPIILLVGTILSPIAAAVAITIIEGIIGNRADDLLGWLLNHLALITWLWIAISILLFLAGYLFLALFRLHQKMGDLKHRSEHMIVMDDGLLKQLTILVSASDMEEAMRHLIKKLLHDAREAFPEVRKASLFLPDPCAPEEYLLPWLLTGWGGEGASPDQKFYIGWQDRDRKVGSAGEAFLRQEILVTKFTRDESRENLIPTRDSYIFFSDDHATLPYNALVCVPIIASASKNKPECLGVVCFDSRNQETFDSPEIRTMLKLLSRRIAVSLEIYERLQKICPIPQQKLSK